MTQRSIRILGIDPCPRGVAFAAFEGDRLLDWGTRHTEPDAVSVALGLMAAFVADVLVIEDPDANRCARRPRMRLLLRRLATAAQQLGVDVALVSRHEVRCSWAARGATRSQAIAAEIGRLLPEVEPLVPPRRKSFEGEQKRSHVFDAISLVLHLSESLSGGATSPESTAPLYL